MSRILPLLTVFVACSLAACGDDSDKVQILVFQASPDAIEAGQSTKLVFAVQPATAKVTISSGVGDLTGKTEASVTPSDTTTYQLTAVSGSATANQTVKVTVGATSAAAIKVQPATKTPTAGAALAVTLTVLGPDGNPAPGFRGTLHVTSTDAGAVLPADITFTAAEAGTKQVMVTLKTAGVSTLTATDMTGKASASGSASLTVQPAAAHSYQLKALPGSATAGQPLTLTITVLDVFGNVATAYGGKIHLTSADTTDVLPPDGTFTAGVQSVSLEFTKTGSHVAQVQDVASSLPSANTSSVAIGPAAAFRVGITQDHASTTAGTSESFTATVFDSFSNIATNYTGTLHFAATDPSAAVPADFAFGAGDAGTHSFSLTPKTAGSVTLAVNDAAATSVTGGASWTVGAAAAATCTAGQAPGAAVAGSVVGLTVTTHDPFGNQATGYTGTVRLTASDARATLPGDVTFGAGDVGSHAFSVALITTGDQTVTATDLANPAIQCSAVIKITPGAPKVVLALPADANAGYPVSVGVAVKDLFDNAIPNYAGTVSFTSTDTGTGAAAPADITFTGSEGGATTASATFVTIGAQTLSAAATGTPQGLGSVVARIHGLVYTAPATGRVRLVANATQSSAQTIQLDLVAGERLEVSTFFGGPGSFSAGMNLPLDTTRVGTGSPLFTRGPALPAGTGVPASVGVLGPDHVLYTGVSRKRVTGSAVVLQDTQVEAGQVFYSVKLKLTQNGVVGTVFDGAQPTAMFRAAVRDQFGDDFVGQSDFGVGKLEIR
jgi:protocatechuate 3,4-dioxygenase beta subunit